MSKTRYTGVTKDDKTGKYTYYFKAGVDLATGEPYQERRRGFQTAKEAFEAGMINEICPPEELEKRTFELAQKYASGPLQSYKSLKKLMYESMYKDFERFLEIECRLQTALTHTADYKEGITSFVEKRKPVFTGK